MVTQNGAAMAIRFAEFDRLCQLRGWRTDAEIARQLQVSQATIRNMRVGRTGAGPKVINAVLRTFGAAVYDVLFEPKSPAGVA